MTRLIRPLDREELEAVQFMLRTELLDGLGLWEEYDDYKFIEKVIGTTVGEAALEKDVQSMLKLPIAHVQRVQVFLVPPEGLSQKFMEFREKVINGIKARDSSLPDENGVVMTVDFATSDAFRHPFHLDLKRVVGWIGRLLVRRAVFGAGPALLLEFGRDLGPEEWISIGAGFGPTGWRVQGRRVLLYL
jgi:hypothetical protein